MKVIATLDKRKIVVFGKVAFYESSGTSTQEGASIETAVLRKSTYIPFFGLTEKEHFIKINAIESKGGVNPPAGYVYADYEIVRETIGIGQYAYHIKFDDQLSDLCYKKQLIDKDMAMRFRYYDAMVMSAMLGGGFWETTNGQTIIAELEKNCPYFKRVGIEAAGDVLADGRESISPKEVNDLLAKNGAVLSAWACVSKASSHSAILAQDMPAILKESIMPVPGHTRKIVIAACVFVVAAALVAGVCDYFTEDLSNLFGRPSDENLFKNHPGSTKAAAGAGAIAGCVTLAGVFLTAGIYHAVLKDKNMFSKKIHS